MSKFLLWVSRWLMMTYTRRKKKKTGGGKTRLSKIMNLALNVLNLKFLNDLQVEKNNM